MKTETKVSYTPGPWTAHPPSSIVGSLISYGDLTKGENVAAVYPQRLVGQCAANARLIAKAPEMAEALSKFMGLYQASQQGVDVDYSEIADWAERVLCEAGVDL